MSDLILYPTEMSLWHAVLSEAESNANVVLSEDAESYLVFLMMRYGHSTDWVDSIVALDFLEAMHANERQHSELLRDVGDKSLMFSGLFPEIVKQRNVKLDYYTSMGRAAYLSLSELRFLEEAALYQHLCDEFLILQSVLRGVRQMEQQPYLEIFKR